MLHAPGCSGGGQIACSWLAPPVLCINKFFGRLEITKRIAFEQILVLFLHQHGTPRFLPFGFAYQRLGLFDFFVQEEFVPPLFACGEPTKLVRGFGNRSRGDDLCSLPGAEPKHEL